MRRDRLLTLLTLVGIVGGAAVGQLLHASSLEGAPISDLWWTGGNLLLIRPLMAMIIPLIFVSVVVGVTSVGEPSKLGLLGGATLFYFVSTMLIAVVLGATLVVTIAPGEGLAPHVVEQLLAQGSTDLAAQQTTQERVRGAEGLGLGGAWLEIISQVIPNNVLADAVNGRPLGVIVFAMALGLALALGGESTKPAIRVFEGILNALMRIIGWIIWMTPIGVFLLIVGTVGKVGGQALLGPLGNYVLTVTTGLLIHALIVLPLILWVLARTNPFRFFWAMRPALLTAFGTSSSSATLPVTLRTAVEAGGCSKRSSGFVLPLGTTINMDGTALYEAVATVFLFQLHGIELSFGELVVVVVTATLAAIGAAGIPSAGLVTMVIVISAVNASLQSRGVDTLPITSIGVILALDRFLDMMRTTVNVWGDAVGAKLLTRLVPDEE